MFASSGAEFKALEPVANTASPAGIAADRPDGILEIKRRWCDPVVPDQFHPDSLMGLEAEWQVAPEPKAARPQPPDQQAKQGIGGACSALPRWRMRSSLQRATH